MKGASYWPDEAVVLVCAGTKIGQCGDWNVLMILKYRQVR